MEGPIVLWPLMMQLRLSKHSVLNLVLIVLGKEDWGKSVSRYDRRGALAEKGSKWMVLVLASLSL